MGGKETVAPKKVTTDKLEQKISMKTAFRKQHETAALVKLRIGYNSKKQQSNQEAILREQQRKDQRKNQRE
jgi:hypothetical protein